MRYVVTFQDPQPAAGFPMRGGVGPLTRVRAASVSKRCTRAGLTVTDIIPLMDEAEAEATYPTPEELEPGEVAAIYTLLGRCLQVDGLLDLEAESEARVEVERLRRKLRTRMRTGW